MGLDFRGADAHWSYGGFHRFRIRLVELLGCDFKKTVGDPILGKPQDEAENEKFLALKDPITPLIMHSDCDGHITPSDCKRIAPRLLELIKDWPDDDYDKEQATKLAEGMLKCAKKGKSLIFT